MARTTTSKKPPAKSSDEADREQLKMARDQGKVYQEALKHMTQEEADGKSKAAGQYLVSYAVEDAEGMYHMMGGKLMWHNPTDENCHVEIVVQDGTDKRFIPELNVKVTLKDSAGREVGTYPQPFMWHPWLYHYGRNWTVPGPGKYSIEVTIDPPSFMRHDKENGLRYAETVTVTFADVEIETGQKIS